MKGLSLKILYERGESLKDWDRLKRLIEIRSQYYKIFLERQHGKKMVEQVVFAAKNGEKGFDFSPRDFLNGLDEEDKKLLFNGWTIEDKASFSKATKDVLKEIAFLNRGSLDYFL